MQTCGNNQTVYNQTRQTASLIFRASWMVMRDTQCTGKCNGTAECFNQYSKSHTATVPYGNRLQIGFCVENLTRLGDVCRQRAELWVRVGYMKLFANRELNREWELVTWILVQTDSWNVCLTVLQCVQCYYEPNCTATPLALFQVFITVHTSTEVCKQCGKLRNDIIIFIIRFLFEFRNSSCVAWLTCWLCLWL
jgi:hypothetical protein